MIAPVTSPGPRDATVSAPQVRAIAVHAAGLPGSLDNLTDVLRRLGSVQLDAIGVLAKAHQLTIACRLRRATISNVDAQLWHTGSAVAFDYPAHAAALVAVEDWPLWAFRRRAACVRDEYPDPRTRQALLHRIDQEGALRLAELRDGNDAGHGGWAWSPTKRAIEFLVWSGELACVARHHGHQRLFDLAERVIPPQHLTDHLSDRECLIRLLERAGNALGVATPDDLADYLRIRTATIHSLLPDTTLIPVAVEGWAGTAWAGDDALRHADREIDNATLLGPFDNLIWYRRRVARIFGFEHTFEAYKPVKRRRHGYYVCPVRVDAELVGRADLAFHQGTITVLKASIDQLTDRNLNGLTHAFTALAGILEATKLHVPAHATDNHTAAALRRALA
jgi:uncharacterized protein